MLCSLIGSLSDPPFQEEGRILRESGPTVGLLSREEVTGGHPSPRKGQTSHHKAQKEIGSHHVLKRGVFHLRLV